jgi:hypothetical protein
METKKYSSYAQIENDLEILKIEKKIHYHKILLGIDKTKESLVPSKAMSFVGNVYENVFSGVTGTIIKTLIPIAISWYKNRKRGD